MVTVYVLKSTKNGKRYVGITTKPIDVRLSWHEQGLTRWTAQNGPFELVYQEISSTKLKAIKREKYFKTGQGRRTLDLLMNRDSTD